MKHTLLLTTASLLTATLLSACSDTTPIDKSARYDQASGTLEHPSCPDWSQPSTFNYDNSLHTNYGCAVNRNLAVQLANPADLAQGHGTGNADTEATINTIDRYRAGEIPEPLVPQASEQ